MPPSFPPHSPLPNLTCSTFTPAQISFSGISTCQVQSALVTQILAKASTRIFSSESGLRPGAARHDVPSSPQEVKDNDPPLQMKVEDLILHDLDISSRKLLLDRQPQCLPTQVRLNFWQKLFD